METIEEIREFFKPKKRSYAEALHYVKALLDNYHRYTDEGRRAIYRVATREDYGGEEFKTEESIQEKLRDRRESSPNKYGLEDIDDFVGLRVVCVYPSDVDTVKAHIRKLRNDGKLAKCDEEQVTGEVKIKLKVGLTKVESGYKAWHLIVSPPGRLAIFNCEVQVLTMLQDAAAVKSHDLIYKPVSVVKERHVRQAKLLSDSLEAIDEQSKMLEREIRRKRHMEEEKKKAAKKALILDLLRRGEFPEGSEIERLRGHIISKEEELRYRNADEELNWIGCMANKKVDINLCRLATLLAIINRTYEEYALEIIDRCILQALDDRHRSAGHRFKSFFLSVLGKKEAIEEAEKALQCATNTQDEELIRLAKGNIAYFIAEFEQLDKEEIARRYGEEVYNGDPNGRSLDTLGYIYIMLGRSFNEVQKGWQLCRQAFELSERENTEDTEIMRLFLELDEYKAVERLWDFLELEEEAD